MSSEKIVVCVAGGFIGGHLVADLLSHGHRDIRAADLKPFPEWHELFPQVGNLQLDLQERAVCERASQDARQVYNLAADMGGMGFIEHNRAFCMLSVLINTHLLLVAKKFRVERFFFASSAYAHAADKQTSPDVVTLKESYPYPAAPEDGCGWEEFQRTGVPPFPQRLWCHDARCPLSQRLWGGRDIQRQPRVGPGGRLSDSYSGEIFRQARDRDLGRRSRKSQVLNSSAVTI